MNTIKPLAHITHTKSYVPGGKLHGATAPVAMLASNENPLGMPETARKAARAIENIFEK
jgi:histidinol-phosphate aminotransferase